MRQNLKWLLSVCVGLISCLVRPDTVEAQVISPAREEQVKIALKDNYCLTLRFNQYPRYAFNLWLPELAIFDNDNDRSSVAEPVDGVWLAKRQGNLQVKGRLKALNKQMDFRCTLIPQSTSSILLELEVENTGPSDWSDYTHLAICLAPAENNPAFSDSSGDRSYIFAQDSGLLPITRTGEVGPFNHYPVGERNDPQDSIQRSNLDNGYVARESNNGKLTISFMWNGSARVDVNPGGLDCIHSHPATGPLKPGESRTQKGYILLSETSPEDHYKSLQELLK